MQGRRLHKQERANTCTVACLRTVLDLQFGIQVSEQALEAHGTEATSPILVHGTGTRELRRMMTGVNRTHNTGKRWTLQVRNRGTLDQLEALLAAGRYPIVGLYRPDEHGPQFHDVVVLRIKDDRIQLWDPDPTLPRRPLWMNALEFWENWSGNGKYTWYAAVGGG